jgi:hypothetical protein
MPLDNIEDMEIGNSNMADEGDVEERPNNAVIPVPGVVA